MPIIPLPTLSKPLADAAAPVLDRERRPTVDNRGKMQAVGDLSQAGKMPELPMSLAEPAGALGAVGKAIAQAGDVVGALALKRLEADTVVQVSEWDKKMTLANGKIMADAQSDPDFDIEKATIDTNAALRREFEESQKLSPAARNDIALRLNRYEGNSVAGAMEYAAKRSFQKAQDALDGDVELGIETQNPDHFEQGLAGARKLGVMPEWKEKVFRLKYKQRGEQLEKKAKAEAYDTAQNGVAAFAASEGADAAWQKLDTGDFGKLDASDIERLKHYALQVDGRVQANYAAALANSLADGTINSVAKIEEEAARAGRLFPPSLQEKAKDILRNEQSESQREARRLDIEKNGVRNAVEARHLIQELDPSQDPKREKFFETMRMISTRVEPSLAEDLKSELKKKYDIQDNGAKLRPEAQRHVSDLLNFTFRAEGGPRSWVTRVPKTVKNSDGSVKMKDGKPVVVKDSNGNVETEKVVDHAKHERAIEAQAIVEKEMFEWFKTHPNPTPNEIKQKLNSTLPEGTRAGALDAAMKAFPPRADAAADVFRGFQDAPDLQDKLPGPLKPHAQDFREAAHEYGLSAKFLAAISILETDKGTSKAFREKRNAMGISDDHGPKEIASVRESIFHMAKVLSSPTGPYAKAKTLQELGAIYAPPKAKNDFKGTNAQWPSLVRANLSSL